MKLAEQVVMFITELDPTLPEVTQVIFDIDALMNSLYPAESNQLLSLESLVDPNVTFLGITEVDSAGQQQILACGALVLQRDDGIYGELKRIYVQPAHRGKGLSNKIMDALISHAHSLELKYIRLETGIKQLEAVALYEKFGFYQRKEYGGYQYDPLSIYMELEI